MLTFDPLVRRATAGLVAVVVAGVAASDLVRRGSADPGWRRALVGDGRCSCCSPPPTRRSAAAAPPVKRSDANVLFVVDTTGSMAAQDYDGAEPRLVGVRHDVLALADEFPGAHFALVTFNSKTRVIVPWTTDRGALDSAVALLRQEWTQYAKGTRLDEPLPTMRQLLPRSGPDGGYDIVFFLSDGEQTVRRRRSRSSVSTTPSPAAPCSATAPTEGARMHVYVGRDENPELYIHDYDTGTDAVSHIDEDNLSRLAEEMGVTYVHRTEPSDVERDRRRGGRTGRHGVRRRARHRAPAVLAAGVRRDRPRAVAARPDDVGDHRRPARRSAARPRRAST